MSEFERLKVKIEPKYIEDMSVFGFVVQIFDESDNVKLSSGHISELRGLLEKCRDRNDLRLSKIIMSG